MGPMKDYVSQFMRDREALPVRVIVCTENLNASVVVMKSAQDGA
jgi:hypothetical protein